MVRSERQLEEMLNTFAMRLFGSKNCEVEPGENDDEELDNWIDSKTKSQLKRRKKKNKINKKKREHA
jgi:hypothetical protein